MNPTSALSSLQNSNPLLAILWAGFTCGTLDISAALVVYQYFGRPPMRLLQGIAAGVLGSRSFQGGLPTALLGLFCHFFIVFSAATVYLTASRWIPFLLEHGVISGALYGVAVFSGLVAKLPRRFREYGQQSENYPSGLHLVLRKP